MLDIDSNIFDQIQGHAHLKGAISFVCLLSFACSVGLLISLVSIRLWAHLRLRYITRITENHSHLYIFFGMERQMELLADDIRKNDNQSIRIFVEQTMGEEDDGKEGWDHLLAMLTHRRESFKKAKDLNARLTLSNCDITSLEKSKEVLDEIGLYSIKKKVQKIKKLGKKGELHILFLSKDEVNNIESATIIKEDQTIKNAAENGVKVIIYCHARRNSVNRVHEYTTLETSIEIRIIDSAHLTVERLKMKENLDVQPISFVNINKDGTTTSEFNSLVIGFGEVGQDVVRFLYEYGTFVNSDKTNGIRRSSFGCHVVDPDMKVIAPHYMDTHMRMSNPKTNEKKSLIAIDQEDGAFINLHSYSYKDKEFLILLDKIIEKLNYVVIAIKDNVEGITLAVWILKHAMRKKKDLRNLKILLRSYSFEKIAHINTIVKYYNDLFYAEIGNKEIIHIFGKAEDIYSYKSIISDQIRRESWLYYNSYNGVTELPDNDFARLSDKDRTSGYYSSVSQPDFAWIIRRQKELEVHIDSSPKYSCVMSIRRKEAQDMENARHRHTKRLVALKALGNNETRLHIIESGIRNKRITRDESNRYHKNNYELKNIQQLMTTLAQMEHLRWNASHEMLGYVWGPEKNDAYSEHGCLVAWEELPSNEYRGYDYEVVDRSFRLADEERDKKR